MNQGQRIDIVSPRTALARYNAADVGILQGVREILARLIVTGNPQAAQ